MQCTWQDSLGIEVVGSGLFNNLQLALQTPGLVALSSALGLRTACALRLCLQQLRASMDKGQCK